MKNFKPILGISLLVQSISFLILSLVNVEKRKNLAIALGVFSAIGGVAGASLLVSEYKSRKKLDEEFDPDAYFDEILDDFDDFDVAEDEIDCAFAGDEEAVEEA